MDKLAPAERSRNMAKIRGKNTKPELAVRKALYAMGYRYRLHARDLPGRPDITFPSRRKAVFVHGCFWHRHEGCRFAYTPKSRTDFWQAKFERNMQRDAETMTRLQESGWKVLTIWECEVKQSLAEVCERLRQFLGPARSADPNQSCRT